MYDLYGQADVDVVAVVPERNLARLNRRGIRYLTHGGIGRKKKRNNQARYWDHDGAHAAHMTIYRLNDCFGDWSALSSSTEIHQMNAEPARDMNAK
jgi:hypothetical protein